VCTSLSNCMVCVSEWMNARARWSSALYALGVSRVVLLPNSEADS
jgi:hypothetical protein